MKYFFRPLVLICLWTALCLSAAAQEDPNPNSPAPRLLSGADRSRVLALNTNEFRGVLPANGRIVFKPGPASEIVIFLSPLDLLGDESVSAFRVYLTRPGGKTFELKPVSLERTRRGEIAVRVRLYDASGYRGQPDADGDHWMYVTWRGLMSHPLKIGLGRTGGTLRPLAAPMSSANDSAEQNFVGYRWSGDRIRFLEQAAFGPSSATDERLRRIGLRTWLSEQFEAPYPYIPWPNPPQMPTTPPADCTQVTFISCYNERYTMIPLQQWFFKEAFYGNAQLRHKMAWALSQIWVTSGVTTQQSSHAIAFHKILADNAFGNYRKLMYDATLSPTMGNYLDMVRSTRTNPNENYPREILQLFSIGLYMLNQDGTLTLDGQGHPIPTYDQMTIDNLSMVFTGWTFCNTGNCPNAVPGSVNYKDPMVLSPANHDLTAKTLLAYPNAVTRDISACTNCTSNAEIANFADQSMKYALDNIFYHPNVGPFIGKLLIQHFVTSDPSPAYVSRVAGAFNDNGQGERGDMKAVIRAVLLDPEARGDLKTAPRYGKLREPVQLITNLGRIFPAVAFNGSGVSDGALGTSAQTMGQYPFYSPTVFNYFAPDYVIPGTTILAPEFDIFNTGTAVKRTNFLSVYIFNGISPNATDSLRGTALDFSEFATYSEADTTGNLLLDMLNAKMMHGTLSQAHRTTMLPAIQAVPVTDPTGRVRTAAYLISASSQYQIQR
ncbi:MAG: DUF1800 domain-containing protein [Acidobacteria bacterium]|nr:DUF1800 domain-containing protein [Acidobacteriota bacterium]